MAARVAASGVLLIQEPPFRVDFQRFFQAKSTERSSLIGRAREVALGALEAVKILMSAVGSSAYVTLKNSGKSFKHIVFGFYGSWRQFRLPSDMHLILFKTVYWVACMGWCFITTAVKESYQKMRSDPGHSLLLREFSGEEIHPAHIQTAEVAIDMSQVPRDVQVADLLRIFDAINFTDPRAPGYMAPSSRTEGSTSYTAQELRAGVARFADNVNRRVAFLGTPPAYDTPKLMAFYQQIEDATRFSIARVERDLREFRARHGENPNTYNPDQMRQYRDLLENRARVAINLGIAGKHCGARFMGEAMELYDSCRGEGNIERETLQGTLFELLAAKRLEIARAQIQTHLGNDTHAYTRFMGALGGILGLPGAANVSEHLSRILDRDQHLRLFFKQYTVDTIIARIQEQIRASQAFREKITDWFQQQAGDWNRQPLDEAAIAAARRALELKELSQEYPPYARLRNLQELISNHREHFRELDLDSEDFVTNLLTLDAVKGCYAHMIRQEIQELFGEASLGAGLLIRVKEAIRTGEPLAIGEFVSRLLSLSKIRQICRAIGVLPDTAIRIVRGEKDLQEAAFEAQDRERRSEFLEALRVENMAGEGLSPVLIEWLLVSQGILQPQGVCV